MDDTQPEFKPTPCMRPDCEPKRWAAAIGATIEMQCSTCDAKWQADSCFEADCPHEMDQMHAAETDNDHAPTWVQINF